MGKEPCVKLGQNSHSLWEGGMLLGIHSTGRKALPPYKNWQMLFLSHSAKHQNKGGHHTEHEQVSLGLFSLPLFYRDKWTCRVLVPFPEGNSYLCVRRCMARTGHGFQCEQKCCKTVHVLSGEKLSLLVLRHKEPCRDRAASWDRKQCRSRDAATSAVEDRKDSAVRPTLKEQTLAMDSCSASSPLPCWSCSRCYKHQSLEKWSKWNKSP